MSLKEEKNSFQKGFSLLEISVAIFIMVTIGLLVTVNIRSGIRSDELRIAKSQLIQDMRKMQSYSLTGRVCNPQDASICNPTPLSGPDYEYGIQIPVCSAPPCKYKLFIDGTNDDRYTAQNELLTGGEKQVYGNSTRISLGKRLNSSSTYTNISSGAVSFVYKPKKGEFIVKDAGGSTFSENKFKITLTSNLNSVSFIIDRLTGTIIETGDSLGTNGTEESSNTN